MGKNVYTVSESENGLRLDNFLKDRSGLSRAEVQKWIKEGGAILSPDKMIRPNYHVRTGDEIFFTWEEKKELEIIPQDIPIDILYEDDDMMVINKARGMVIHPGSGNPDHTLVNALLYHCGPKLFEQSEKSKNCPTRTLLAIYTHAAWEYIHANRPAKSPGVLENPPQPNKFYPISTQGDYTPQKSSGNMSSSSSKSMVSSSDTSTHSTFSFPLIAHEYISAAARLENTSCIGSPFSNQ